MAANSSSAFTRRCDMCNYSTTRLGNYIRHTQSDAHLNLVHFHTNEDLQAPLDCCSGEPEETETEEDDTDTGLAGFSDITVDVEFTQPPLHHTVTILTKMRIINITDSKETGFRFPQELTFTSTCW